MLAVFTISVLIFAGSDALSCLQCVETTTETYVWYGSSRHVLEDFTPCDDYTGTMCSPGQNMCTTTVIHVNSSLSSYTVIRDCGSLSNYRTDKNAICKKKESEGMTFNSMDGTYNFECKTEVCRTEMCNNGYKEAFKRSGRRKNTGNLNWYYTTDPYKFYFEDPLKARALKPNETQIGDGSWKVDDGSKTFEMQPRMGWKSGYDWNNYEDSIWRDWMDQNDGQYYTIAKYLYYFTIQKLCIK